VSAEVRLYDHLFRTENPEAFEEGGGYQENLNPTSLETLSDCRLEPSLAVAEPGQRFQFERLGYFIVDSVDSSADGLVFNRTVTLRDSWAKIQRRKGK
jgi:glutaminyl-tRNA synthetase